MPETRSALKPALRRRRLLAAVGLPVALALGVAACGSDDEPSESSSTEPSQGTSTAGAVLLNGQWPLTGEKLDGELPDHPVYVVKIDNSSSSAPQIGLSSADLIVEELVEGGITRLAVFYYQSLPDNTGPVRSMRATDIGIVKPAEGTLVASGGAPKTVARIHSAHVITVTEGATGFSRDDSRSAPYNLFMSLPELAADAGDKVKSPKQTYFDFGDAFEGNITVTRMSAMFSGGHTTEWKYTDKGWTRPGGYAQQGDDFVADNVLLLEVQVGDAGYLDPAGNPVPETKFVGKGKGVLVHGDKALRVRWHKGLKKSQLELTSADGKEVPVPTGHTWVELVPAKTGKITLSK